MEGPKPGSSQDGQEEAPEKGYDADGRMLSTKLKSAVRRGADKKYAAYCRMCLAHGIDPEPRGVWSSMNEVQTLWRDTKKQSAGAGMAGLLVRQQSTKVDKSAKGRSKGVSQGPESEDEVPSSKKTRRRKKRKP